jgi:hypothetical protein
MATRQSRREVFEATLVQAGQCIARGDAPSAFAALEQAHVIGQRDFVQHLRVHWRMLHVGWAARDLREVTGQLFRIALVPIGHLAGRLPVGNTGGANVSAFKPMAIRPELVRLLKERDR